MASIRVRKESGTLFFDFRYKGVRCREHTLLKDTPANRRKMQRVLERIEAEITLGTFSYRSYFPESPNAAKFEARERGLYPGNQPTARFEDIAWDWFEIAKVRWKRSMAETVRCSLRKYLIPYFGNKDVCRISREEILRFRASLANPDSGKRISNDCINHIMTPLRQIMKEAACRFQFQTPFVDIEPLKVRHSEVDPFTLDEVQQIIRTVRPDFRSYYIVRFFTGMRTGEVDGLKWKYVDFERRLILVRETIVDGRVEEPKTRSSIRDIQMCSLVYDALMAQREVTSGISEYVFCNRNGKPLDHRNVTKRVWYPLLRHLGLKERRPYQTRHTAATLWLAAGENPEWISRQLGHANSQMLFRVYTRYVPNLTRRDGSAFEALLRQSLDKEAQP